MREWSMVLLVVVAAASALAFPGAAGGGDSACEALLDGLQDDAGSGSDAGDDRNEPTPIPTYAALEGFLLPVAAEDVYQDAADVYVFESDGVGSVVVNVTGKTDHPLEVVLVDPNGQEHPVPEVESTSSVGVGPAGVAFSLIGRHYQVQLEDVPGDWLLEITLAPLLAVGGPVDCDEVYALGGGGGPPSDYAMDVCGCDPWCLDVE